MKTVTLPVTFDLDVLRAALGTSAPAPKAPSGRGRHLKTANARTRDQRAARVVEARNMILEQLNKASCTRRGLMSIGAMTPSNSVPGSFVGYNATAAAFSDLLREGLISPLEGDLSFYRKAQP